MGSVVGKVMEENFKKQQEFMEKNQEVMLERQIQMQNQMRERQAAMMVARSRDMFHFFSAFYLTYVKILERQIQMQNQMRERQAAMMVARSRDMFHFYAAFYLTYAVVGTIGFMKKKNPAIIAPLFPLTFMFAYQGDLAYGDKMQRCREEADKILDDTPELIALPHGLPTMAQIEAARLKK